MRHGLIGLTAFLTLLPFALPGAETYLRVPSQGAGTGGSVAVRLSWPDNQATYRFGIDGAPIVLLVPGGVEPGTFEDASTSVPLLDRGIITMSFIFPGGTDDGQTSDGVYDDRGPLCQMALRDVARFAAGEQADTLGRRITDIVPGNVRSDMLGLLGISNGGMTIVTTLARHAGEFPPVAWFISWESPACAQNIALELPMWFIDPNGNVDADGDGVLINDVYNGAYTAYDFPALEVDYSKIRYDPSILIPWQLINLPYNYFGLFYFDNDGNGVFTTSLAGLVAPDVDGNGIVDADEDFPLIGMPVSRPGELPARGVLSQGAAQAAASLGITWPAHYLTPSEVADFWPTRDGALFFSDAITSQPTMRGMTLHFKTDHAQHSHDHAHVLHYLRAFASEGRWCRANPDAAYIEFAFGAPRPGAPDVDANAMILPTEMSSVSSPDTNLQGLILTFEAAILEMCDRTYTGRWETNLDAVLPLIAAGNRGAWTAYE